MCSLCSVASLEINIVDLPDTMSCINQFVSDITRYYYKFLIYNDCDQLLISRLVVIFLNTVKRNIFTSYHFMGSK